VLTGLADQPHSLASVRRRGGRGRARRASTAGADDARRLSSPQRLRLAARANSNTPPAEYDFGIGGGDARGAAAPAARDHGRGGERARLADSPAIVYRLAYRDAAQPAPTRREPLAGAPAVLFTAQLRQRLAATTRSGVLVPGDGVRANATLRVELQEFSQVFDAPDRSRAVVRVRAVLVSDARLVAQTSFSVDRPAPSPDSAGGARALALAADAAIDRLIGWTADALK
jgi:cholesterol transport system auxiliary component